MAYLWALIGFAVGIVNLVAALMIVRVVLHDRHREPVYTPPIEKEMREHVLV